MNNKKKRYYSVDEVVWVIPEKKSGKIINIDKENLEVEVSLLDNDNTLSLKLWEIDKVKYREKERLNKCNKESYFASVKGGVIPTKSRENAGRDCYARLKPKLVEGKEVYELYIPHLTLAKIPLGFASYLNEEDYLSLKYERGSVGSTGLINVSGLIDSTYIGEVHLQAVPLISNILITSDVDEIEFDKISNTYLLPYGKAICQAVVAKQSEAKDVHISYEELLEKPSSRGVGGWGSSGK